MLKRSVSRLDHTSFGLPCDITVAANLCVGRGGERKGGGGSCGLLSHRVQQQQQQQHASVLKESSWVCSKLCLGIARRDFRTMLSENSSNPAGIEEENNNKADAASQVGIIKEVELDVTSSSMLQEMQQQQLLINSHESQEHMKRTVAELTEDLSRAEMLEHLQFIKRLPHKLLRDIGFIIAGPSLLSNSVELPVVSADLVGGSHSQWASTKVWLKSLRVSDVEAWFSSHRPSTRLGDHFALCVEYVLRFSPLINVHQLLTSQQVLQTVTKTSQDQGLLSEREELLQVSSSSDGGFVVPAADTRSSCPIVPVLEATLSSSAAASERVNSRLEPTHNPTVLLGKRKRKLLRKLERLRLGKGITTTIGEFDFLFQARPATAAQDSAAALTNNHNSAAHDLEVQHWEVSVKYLLYAGPWEIFGMTTPDHAAWSCKDAKESDKEHGCSILSKTGNSNNANKEDADAATTKFVTTLQGRALDYVKDADEFLGCFLGPHVGETLLDRKSRLCNQLALSSNPCAAVMLWNLYGKEAGAEMRSSDSNIEAETVEEYGADDSSMTLTSEAADLQEQVVEMEQVVKVIPRALLKGYLFYEYKLWHYLNSQQYYHAASHNSAEHNGCSNNNNNNNNNSTQIAKEQSETESTVQELHGSGENNNINDVTAIRDDKNQKQTSVSDGEKLQAKSSLNMKHWMGWWTQDLTEFAYLPNHCGSMWYIVPKLEWLSPVVIPSSDKERCAQILSVEAFLVVAAGVQAEAGRLCMPKKSRFLVAELCWETNWKHEQVLKVEEETQAANVTLSTTQDATTEYSSTQQKSLGGIQGAWIETSRGFIVENTWPISKLYKPHGYVVSWSPSLQQLGQLNSSDP